ncbi:MAG TPA: pitrilysin family protein [Polyangiaceae bacterium]
MTYPRWLVGAVAVLGATVTSHATADSASAGTPVPRVVLPNGLVVLLSEDHKAPVVGLELRYAVGSRDDPPDRPGLAALTQRLMVQATKHVGKEQYERWLDSAGAWESRYTTSLDRTIFSVTVPADRVALPLWLWSDQMGFLVERIDDRLVAEQVAVVLNEHAQKIDGAPAGRLHDLVDAAMYPPEHPYHRGWLHGSPDLANVTAREVRAFVQAHYRPEQAILALAGDFESVRALSLAHQYFAPVGTAGSPVHVEGKRPRLDREVRLTVAARVELPMVMLAWATPPQNAPGDAELDLVGQLLTGSRAGWLRWKLVDELKIASQVSARESSRQYGSQFMIEATATRGHRPEELVDAIDQVLQKLQASAPDEHSMHGTTTGFMVDPSFSLEQSGTRADRFAGCEEMHVSGGCLEAWSARYTSVQAEDLSAVAVRELPLSRRVMAAVFPSEDAPIGGELRDVAPRAP